MKLFSALALTLTALTAHAAPRDGVGTISLSDALPPHISATLITKPSNDAQLTFPVSIDLQSVIGPGVALYRFTYDLSNYSAPLIALDCTATVIARSGILSMATSGCTIRSDGRANPTECNIFASYNRGSGQGKAFCSHYGVAGDNYYEVRLGL